MKKGSFYLTVCAVLIALVSSMFHLPARVEASGSEQAVNNFYNVIMQDGADPWIYKHTDGWYYFTMTTGSNITIWRSKSITGLDAGEQTVVWTPDGSGGNCRDIWAPELHYLNGKWYIYYAATTCDGNNDNHRMFVLENSNADPFSG